jgi:ribosomal protein S18 acetylase RimI-like enzyme
MNKERMSTPRFEIAPANLNDLRPLVDIEETASLQIYPNEKLGITREDIAAIGWGDERVKKYRQRYLDNPHANIWVARTGSEIVGFAAATKTDGHSIPKLYIAPNSQGKGAGSELLRRAEEWLGIDQDITIGVATYNENALRFYLKHGYEPLDVRLDDQTTIPATGQVIREVLFIKRPTRQVSQ